MTITQIHDSLALAAVTTDAIHGDQIQHDSVALSADTAAVVRDEHGVPVEWTLLKIGDNPITQEGKNATLALSADDMQSILDYHKTKGTLIPVDSQHYLHHLATSKKLDEAEVLKLLPSGVAAMGFGSLALAGDQLRFKVKWTPTAYKLLKEKIFKYFSPALRGLVNPPLRLTSVAMENEPAINHLDALAASANHKPSDLSDKNLTRRSIMTKLEKAIAVLLGRDSIALAAEDVKIDEELATAVESKASMLAELRKSLKLDDDVADDVIVAALKSLIEKAGGAEALNQELDTLKSKVDELELSANKKVHGELIAQGVREGKITPATKEWFEKLDHIQLSSYLPSAPVIVAPGKIDREGLAPADNIVLTAEDRATIKRFGFKEEDYLKSKKGA